MPSTVRSAALAALLLTTGCTSNEPDPDQGGQCIDGKCDGFGGAEVLSALSQDVVNVDSYPRGFTQLGDKALFFSTAKRGLWITDGTEAGTKLVRDLAPVIDSYQQAPKIVLFNGKGYYSWQYALWVTDGTPDGTMQVASFTSSQGFMTDPFIFNGSLVFGVQNALYVSDGTTAGTQVLAPVTSYPPFAIAGTHMYFPCAPANVGAELCVTDKTAAGTQVVKDIKPGTASSGPEILGSINDKIVFTISAGPVGQRALWVSDGTDAGTVQVFAAPTNTDAVRADAQTVTLGNHLYFPCYTDATGYELCKSDGTVAGTTAIDLVAGSGQTKSAFPTALAVFANKVFFVGVSPTLGRELWATDGTAAGSGVVVDLRTTSGDPDGLSALTTLVPVGDKLLFAARGNGMRPVLYGTDGTAAGTQQIADLVDPGATQKYPFTFMNTLVLGDKVLFEVDDGTHGDEPWISDGTTQGTHLLLDVAPPTTNVRAFEALTFGNGTYLGIDDGQATSVWRTNGAASGTGMFQQLDHQAAPDFTPVGSTLYFTGFESLWKTSGTTATTSKVRDMPGNLGGLVALGNELAFTGGTANSSLGMWLSDGTASGTVESGAINAERLGVANGRLWLTALYGSAGNELFTSDGTVAGTQPVLDINVNGDSKPGGFVAVGGVTLFAATDAVAGRELWKTDGTPTGTQRIIDISPGSRGSSPQYLFAWKNDVALFWATSSATTGFELWRTDGTAAGTTRVSAATLPTFGVTTFVAWGSYVFFVGHDDGGDELWRTDGTESGTVRVADIYTGAPSSAPSELVLASPTGPLYFVAQQPATGREIWKLATETGTPELALDVLPGPHSSNPSLLRPRGSALLFVADDGHGQALFRLGDEPDVIPPTVKCPDDISVTTSSQSGVEVTYAAATAHDNEGTPTVDATPASGSVFPVGTTTVTATATDTASNTATCTFKVTVALAGGGSGSGSGSDGGTGGGTGMGGGGEPASDEPGGCSASSGRASAFPIVLALGILVSRRRRARR